MRIAVYPSDLHVNVEQLTPIVCGNYNNKVDVYIGNHKYYGRIEMREFGILGGIGLLMPNVLEEQAEVEDWLEKEGWLRHDCYCRYGLARQRVNEELR